MSKWRPTSAAVSYCQVARIKSRPSEHPLAWPAGTRAPCTAGVPVLCRPGRRALEMQQASVQWGGGPARRLKSALQILCRRRPEPAHKRLVTSRSQKRSSLQRAAAPRGRATPRGRRRPRGRHRSRHVRAPPRLGELHRFADRARAQRLVAGRLEGLVPFEVISMRHAGIGYIIDARG